MLLRVLLSALITIIVAACGNESNGGGGSSSIDGTSWTSGCTNMGVPGAGAATFSFQTIYSFSAGNLESRTMSYAAAGCTEATKASTLTRSGTYTVGETSTDVPEATNLDLIESKIFFTLHNDNEVTTNNSSARCGKSDWKKDETTEITGLSCPDSEPKSTFTIFKIDGSSLYFGQADSTNDGTSADKRIKALSESPMKRI